MFSYSPGLGSCYFVYFQTLSRDSPQALLQPPKSLLGTPRARPGTSGARTCSEVTHLRATFKIDFF